ncbi:hypothetical protein Pan97_18790 [Bremerella volcania]|uniref:Tll0287-like domain-containing protein n=1 Tax=Bremerella volcania TaxID=2527984 RepID=A0A518C6L6_9BACT|nr:DUF3365 domain-containing protein [Bremerella volcania]QDU74861.1 hypothetical protein Pan97_18790 [Bremerella volcania]
MRASQAVLWVLFATILSFSFSSISHGEPSEKDASVERARKTVQMIDDIYKGGIVLITENYVHDEDDLPAGIAFKKLFASAEEKGWHSVRLLDATDEPYNPENAPADAFEKNAIKALLSGKPGYEQVIEKEGKRYLRSATPVPVVMQKCTMCHEHYADVKPGTPIGAISYTVPIEN